MPSQKEQIERLSAENAELKEQVAVLTEKVANLVESVEVLGAQQNDTFVRVEGVEENLCELRDEQVVLQNDQASMMLRLEGQQQYSRKQTLLLTGSAVELPPRSGTENIREVVLGLLATYLGISGLREGAICACHRLKNKKVILVRFADMADSDKVYRARTKPKRTGLLVFESLTTERLAVINMIKTLKDDPSSPVLSYFTQNGKIFVKTSTSREVDPIEIPFGASLDDIRSLCEGHEFSPTPTAIREQFRAIHARAQGAHPWQKSTGQVGRQNQWITVRPKGRGRGSGQSRNHEQGPVGGAGVGPALRANSSRNDRQGESRNQATRGASSTRAPPQSGDTGAPGSSGDGEASGSRVTHDAVRSGASTSADGVPASAEVDAADSAPGDTLQ